MLLALNAGAFDLDRYWNRLQPLLSEQVKKAAIRHLWGEPMQPDSAMVCLRLITSRYNEDMDRGQKEDVIKAYSLQWWPSALPWVQWLVS